MDKVLRARDFFEEKGRNKDIIRKRTHKGLEVENPVCEFGRKSLVLLGINGEMREEMEDGYAKFVFPRHLCT